MPIVNYAMQQDGKDHKRKEGRRTNDKMDTSRNFADKLLVHTHVGRIFWTSFDVWLTRITLPTFKITTTLRTFQIFNNNIEKHVIPRNLHHRFWTSKFSLDTLKSWKEKCILTKLYVIGLIQFPCDWMSKYGLIILHLSAIKYKHARDEYPCHVDN